MRSTETVPRPPTPTGGSASTAAHTALNRRVSARDRPQSAIPLPSAGSGFAGGTTLCFFGGMEALVTKKGSFDPVTRRYAEFRRS